MTDVTNYIRPDAPAAAMRTTRPRAGIIDKLASQLDMDPGKFERMLIDTVFPNGKGTPIQVAALCAVAVEYDLNPLTKQVYAFPGKGGGIIPVISADGWYAIANRHPQFDGLEFELHFDNNADIAACTATVHRKDRKFPTKITETMKECFRPTDPWRKQPTRMIRHRAAIQAIRVAFGIAGVEPEDAPRIVEFEEKRAESPAHKGEEIHDQLREQAKAYLPEAKAPAEEERPAEEAAQRTRRSRAVKAQVEEFHRMVESGVIDEGMVGDALPEEGAIDEAFTSLWRDDAETFLERARTGDFRAPTVREEADPVYAPETEDGFQL